MNKLPVKHLLIIAISWMITLPIIPAQTDEGFRSAEAAKGLNVGEKVPDFTASGLGHGDFQLSESLKSGPVVVVFYRGQWCPVCNRHLSSLQDSLDLIIDKGAQLIAISPEKPEYEQKTAQKTGATFRLLYDEDYRISKIFDVLFRPDSSTLHKYNTVLDANLKQAQSDESQRIPIPATFIIDRNRQIIWRQFHPDYRIRASVKDILKHLP